jgi:ribosomal protein S18 acetylase RimI-like enzyme
MPDASFVVDLCPQESHAAALKVLYRRIAEPARSELVAAALVEHEAGRLDLSGLWIARRRGHVVGALLTQRLVGRAAAVWPPEVSVPWGLRRAKPAAALVRAALESHRQAGIRVVQSLLDPYATSNAPGDLAAGGLPHITELLYMGRRTDVPLNVAPGTPSFTWHAYPTIAEADFRALLQATYAESLDMPELEGVRSLDDVLASHRAAGRFDPNLWYVGRLPGEPDAAAVLLLIDQPERNAVEISYLGLTPQARGRGLGHAVLAHARVIGASLEPRLELAVDVRNTPAVKLYQACGFSPFERRSVHLAVFRDQQSVRSPPAPDWAAAPDRTSV